MKKIEKIKVYAAALQQVFDCLDDLGVTGMHMTKSSAAMMGGKMNIEFLSPNKRGLHTRYRWVGKVLWMDMDFTVEVTRWVSGKEKIWETVGPTNMIIYSWFQMQLHLEPAGKGSLARLSISYKEPEGFWNKLLCFLVGGWYSRWCINNMLRDTEKNLKAGRSQNVADVV